MPRTVEHIVEMHDLVTERRKAGKKAWADRVTVTLNDDDEFEARRDEFANALKASRWFRSEGEDSELASLWDELKDADDADHFDAVMDAIYDEADYARVWIEVKHI